MQYKLQLKLQSIAKALIKVSDQYNQGHDPVSVLHGNLLKVMGLVGAEMNYRKMLERAGERK